MSTADARTALTSRLDQAERDMRALASGARRSNWITLLLGLAVLAGLSAYFWIGYSEINKFLQPDELVGVAQGLLDDNIPQVRGELETQIKTTAPELARSLSQQAMDAIPQGRAWLAETIDGQIRDGLQQTSLVTLEQLRDFLRNNKPLIERDLQTLSTNAELAEGEIDEMVKLLEAELGEDFRQRAFTLYETASGIQDHLEKLAVSRDLTPREQSIRRLMTYARRLQSETLGDRPLPRLGTADARPVLPAVEAAPADSVEKPDAAPAADEKPASAPSTDEKPAG